MIADTMLDRLTDAVVGAAPKLDELQRSVALATFREVASGRPATTTAIARRAGVDDQVAARQLAAWSGVFRDDAADVVGFWGIAIPEMPHRIRVDGVNLHAWCAWDPLFLAHLLGDLEVETADPITREPIRYRVDADGMISRPSHPATIVSFLMPEGEWGEDVQATFCHHVLHFTDRSTAEAWTASHSGTTLLTLDEAAELGRRFAAQVFGVDRR